MSDPIQSMIDNMPANTGKSLDEWFAVLDASGLEKHGELLAHLKSQYGVGHGYANLVAMRFRARGSEEPSTDDLVDAQYAGAKVGLRPIHDAIVAAVTQFGPDVEIAPKKTSVSLRRHKQFALIEPASAKRVQLGIQLGSDAPTDRLLPGNAMCSHRVNLTSVDELDDEVLGWLRDAHERA